MTQHQVGNSRVKADTISSLANHAQSMPVSALQQHLHKQISVGLSIGGATIVPDVVTSRNQCCFFADKIKFCIHNVVHCKRMPALPVQLHVAFSLQTDNRTHLLSHANFV